MQKINDCCEMLSPYQRTIRRARSMYAQIMFAFCLCGLKCVRFRPNLDKSFRLSILWLNERCNPKHARRDTMSNQLLFAKHITRCTNRRNESKYSLDLRRPQKALTDHHGRSSPPPSDNRSLIDFISIACLDHDDYANHQINN